MSFQSLVSREGTGTLECTGVGSFDYASLQLMALNCVRSRVKKIRSLVGSSEQTDLMKVTISTHMAPRATHKSGASGTQGVVGSLPVLHPTTMPPHTCMS